MDRNNFTDALSKICNDPEFEAKLKKRKRRKTLKRGLICAGVIIAVAGGIFLYNGIGRRLNESSNPVLYNETEATPGIITEIPYNETSGKVPEETPAATEEITKNDETAGPEATNTPSEDPSDYYDDSSDDVLLTIDLKWFDDSSFSVKQLTYASADADIRTFGTENLGVRHISAEVKYEHVHCNGCYYNAETGEVVCLNHEFLAASGLKLNEGYSLAFYSDHAKENLTLVRLYDDRSVLNEGLWLYDRNTKKAIPIGLPDGCDNYNNLYVYEICLWGGKLVLSVNQPGGRHYTYIIDTLKGESFTVPETENGDWSSAEFIGENILLLTADGYSFLNINNGLKAGVVGEYNYYTAGKVFSVKNNGWASHKDVEVAVYDAETGEVLENENVLVQTVMDDGTMAFIIKNSTSGEETVILSKYSQSAYTWSNDYAYFYAYSEATEELVCYSAADGLWIKNTVPGIPAEIVKENNKQFAVNMTYSLAVAGRYNEVILYYARTLCEIPLLPDYEEEKVDSPYWDKYREIKSVNFDSVAEFAVFIDRNDWGICVNELNWIRDRILDICGSERIEKLPVENVRKSRRLYIMCGLCTILLFEHENSCYAYLQYNMRIPVNGWGIATEYYEISRELFDNMVNYYYEVFEAGRWF